MEGPLASLQARQQPHIERKLTISPRSHSTFRIVRNTAFTGPSRSNIDLSLFIMEGLVGCPSVCRPGGTSIFCSNLFQQERLPVVRLRGENTLYISPTAAFLLARRKGAATGITVNPVYVFTVDRRKAGDSRKTVNNCDTLSSAAK